MLLNSNSDNLNFSLIRTFFWSFGQKRLSLIQSSVQSQTGRKMKKNTQFLHCGKTSFSLLINFASPEKWSMQGICSPSPLPKFTLLPVTSARQQFSWLARRKYETVFAKRADFPLEGCPTTSPHLLTANAHLSYLCSLVRVELWEFLDFWESTSSCKHDNLWYEFADHILWSKILINLLLLIN